MSLMLRKPTWEKKKMVFQPRDWIQRMVFRAKKLELTSRENG